MRTGKTAFTLVELLVVMALVSILMAMLLPVLNNARKNAQGVYCANQERQMYFGVQTTSEMIYKNRWLSWRDDSLSAVWNRQVRVNYFKGKLDGSGKDPSHGGWNQKQNEANGGLPMLCPCDVDYRAAADSTWVLGNYTSYGLNWEGFGCDAPGPKFSQVQYPSKLILLGDASAGLGFGKKYGATTIMLGRYSPQNAIAFYTQWHSYLGVDRHLGRANVAFTDGHVKAHTAYDLLWSSTDAEKNILWYGRPTNVADWWK